MIVGILRLDRQECARAHMQRQRLAADPGSIKACDQFRREMQRRGGRGDRAFFACEHRLVIARVASSVARLPAI